MKLQALLPAMVAVALCSMPLGAFGAEQHKIIQMGRMFSVEEIEIDHGDTLAFTNDDEFIHQIYVDSPTLKFDSAEQPPGKIIQLTFPDAGTFEVHCHIHPKMRLVVRVK